MKRAFRYLMFIFLFFVFLKNDYLIDFLYINTLMTYVVYIVFFFIFLAIVNWLDQWIASIRYTFAIQLITIFLVLLFFTYEMFTPYFYTQDHLKRTGLEKIEMYHELSNEEISEEERANLTEDAFIKLLAHAYSIGQYPIDPIEKIEIVDFKRNYYQFEITVKGIHNGLEKRYKYTLEKEGFELKISGFANLL